MKFLLFGFFTPATLLSHCVGENLGGQLVRPRTTFPEISNLIAITVSMCGFASLPLGGGEEERKAFKSMGSEITENENLSCAVQ